MYERYNNILTAGNRIQSGDDVPFFSFSSMSPILGGFIALMKERNTILTADDCRRILIETSYINEKKGQNWYDINPCDRVVEIRKAVELV